MWWSAPLVAAALMVTPALATGHAGARKWACSGIERVIFDNTNVALVGNGGRRPTFGTAGKAYCVTSIQTYHWNNGRGAGAAGGFVGLSAWGTALGGPGPVGWWKTTSASGQEGAPNANWRAYLPRLPPVVIRGTYSCNDSAPGTWSQNQASAGLGFCTVAGIPAVLTR